MKLTKADESAVNEVVKKLNPELYEQLGPPPEGGAQNLVDAVFGMELNRAIPILRDLINTHSLPPNQHSALRTLITAVYKPTVSREEMVEKARTFLIDRDDYSAEFIQYASSAMTAFALEHASTPLWRKVEDGWPTQRGFYWVTRTDGRVQKQPFDVNADPPWGFAVDVIAWMPDKAPDPYQPADHTDEGGRE